MIRPDFALKVVQNAYVTTSLEATCNRLNRQFGIGPFLVGRHQEMPNHIHRGVNSAPVVIHAAFAQAGPMNIEVVECVSAGCGPFSGAFAPKEGGFHHVAHFCDDFQRERDSLEAGGYEVVSEFSSGDFRVAFVDTRAAFGHMLELYSRSPFILGLYERTRLAAETWDGEALFQAL